MVGPFTVRICPEQQLLELRGNEKKDVGRVIDILKCLAAIAVIEIHKPLEIQGGDEFLILCRFAVLCFL